MRKFSLVSVSVILLFSLLSFSSASFTKKQTVSSRTLITQMMKAIDDVKTLRYDLKTSERIDGKLRNYESKVKLQRSPRKLYMNLKGVEILWIEGKNNGNALVNPNAFPYVNLNLSPYGSIMNDGQHHTIHEIGFDYFKGVIEYAATEVGDKFDKSFLYTGEEKINGRDTYKVTILNNDFAYLPYIVKKGETMISIARKLRLSEYMIKEHNPSAKSYTDIKEGQQLLIPNGYAKMTVICIDKQLLLPISSRVYDEKSLFESYEYLNLQVDSKIPDEEFSKEYKDYHF